MFIPLWLIYVIAGLVVAYISRLHRERDRLKEAFAESQQELEGCEQELEELQGESDVEED
jgi:hypothetical protein